MPRFSLVTVLILAVLTAFAGPALAQSGGERFCKQYASSAADNARQAIQQNPSCQDFSKGMHANESMHYLWCMRNQRSEVEGAFDNIIRLANRCAPKQAPQPGAQAPQRGARAITISPGRERSLCVTAELKPFGAITLERCAGEAPQIFTFDQRSGQIRAGIPGQCIDLDRGPDQPERLHLVRCNGQDQTMHPWTYDNTSGTFRNLRDGICWDLQKGSPRPRQKLIGKRCATNSPNQQFAMQGPANAAAQPAQSQRPQQAQVAGPAPIQPAARPQAGLQFDQPSEVRKLPPNPRDGAEVTCTYFPDLMIREAGEGPTAQKAALVRGGQSLPCGAKPLPGQTTLETEDMAFQGRKGAALFFSHVSPHGSTPFVVIDAQSGKTVLSDTAGSSDPLIQAASFDNGGLRLRYHRGVNAPCSILDNAAQCSAQMIRDGLLPQDMANQVPSPKICEAAYREFVPGGVPKDAHSIVSYQNEVVVYGNGDAQVLSRGPIECGVVP